MNKLRRFPELLGNSDLAPLEGVLQRGRQLNRLGALVKEVLGPELAPHTQVGNIRGETLILLVSTTAWATRVRYSVPDLLQRFQKNEKLRKIKQIEIRIRPAQYTAATKATRKAALSADAAYCIRQCADSVSDDKLRKALSRLASRRSKQES